MVSAQPTTAPSTQPNAATRSAKETNCNNGIDDDGDTVYDCGDADCATDPACRADGNPESTNRRCSDWIDNDSDGATDCDDSDCQVPGITACKGSWQPKPSSPQPSTPQQAAGGAAATPAPSNQIPKLGPGMTVEDLIGKYGDKDGERNDVYCSDGIDNDHDGRTDCADFGCRFDPTVSVCQGRPSMVLSVVGRAETTYDFESEDQTARFSRIQVRALGPMPFITNSFFLLSLRLEKTPRLTFAMFQVPLGNTGHYININSGAGGLSNTLVRSASKRLLLDPAYYVFNAFQQGNGVSLQVGGPIDSAGILRYRAFISGGSGRFSGNVGGGFFSEATDSFTYTGGAQLHINAVGFYSRWDTPFLYVPVPLTVAFLVGGKWDQRAQERFGALNLFGIMRYWRFWLQAESYGKREIEFGSWQVSYNVQLGVLLLPKWLMFAADVGQYLASSFDNKPPTSVPRNVRQPLDEFQWRAALHFYYWRNIGLASVVYTDRTVAAAPGQSDDTHFRELKFALQYSF